MADFVNRILRHSSTKQLNLNENDKTQHNVFIY